MNRIEDVKHTFHELPLSWKLGAFGGCVLGGVGVKWVVGAVLSSRARKRREAKRRRKREECNSALNALTQRINDDKVIKSTFYVFLQYICLQV